MTEISTLRQMEADVMSDQSKSNHAEDYVSADPQARIVYGTPGHSDGYPVVERAMEVLRTFGTRGLNLACYSVNDHLGNGASSIVAPSADVAEQEALRRFSERGSLSKGRIVYEDAEVDVDWLILHCQTANDVSRFAEQVEGVIRTTGREPLKRTTLRLLCEASGLEYDGPDEVVLMRHGGGHLPINWCIDGALIGGTNLAEKAFATVNALAELGMEEASLALGSRISVRRSGDGGRG
jgi:hypothetical protein